MSTVMSSVDKSRLEPVLGPGTSWPSHHLRNLIDTSKIVTPKRIPPDVVTMNSRVRIRDLQWDEVEVVTLVYPDATGYAPGSVSVTAPLGAALLGARVGEEARWMGARGPRRVVVEAIEFQPESAGQYDL
ncbi:MAG TPA: GreA/GreB family elongation factor [Phycisphaerales bacterium]|nr:GreA/GreB family elongation factor [Phycisphaerales bacterium]